MSKKDTNSKPLPLKNLGRPIGNGTGKNKEAVSSSVIELLFDGLKKDYGRRLNTMSIDTQIILLETSLENLKGAIQYIRKFKSTYKISKR